MNTFYHTYIKGNRLNQIIAINVAVFALIGVAEMCGLKLENWFAASNVLGWMLHRPWTVITHMFTHANVGHILFNMMALYFMGQFFLQLQSVKRFTILYFVSGLGGYLLFFLFFGLFGSPNEFHFVVGASAAVMGVVVASAVLKPLQPIALFGIIRMELRWMAVLMVLIDLFSIKEGTNTGGHVGHLGGALFGFIYAKMITGGVKMPWEYWSVPWSKSRMKVTHNQARPKSDDQFNAERKARQVRMDIILDKISRSGYDSLTKDEKDFLFQQAQK
jgi:membrane associated rhomboid family serine protease